MVLLLGREEIVQYFPTFLIDYFVEGSGSFQEGG
jgi:hypothetical protein